MPEDSGGELQAAPGLAGVASNAPPTPKLLSLVQAPGRGKARPYLSRRYAHAPRPRYLFLPALIRPYCVGRLGGDRLKTPAVIK
jgi:hypothetical protein